MKRHSDEIKLDVNYELFTYQRSNVKWLKLT